MLSMPLVAHGDSLWTSSQSKSGSARASDTVMASAMRVSRPFSADGWLLRR